MRAPVQIAKRQAVVNPEDTFFSVKRFIGSKFEEVKEESTQVPYRVKEDSSGNVKLTSNHAQKDFAPEEISAQVLRKLVDDAGTPFPPLPRMRAVVACVACPPCLLLPCGLDLSALACHVWSGAARGV